MHEAQAATDPLAYGLLMDGREMAYWIALAAKQARIDGGLKQVRVAARADVDQSTIWRFEDAGTYPRDPDLIVRAYAEELGLEPIDLWARAVELWRGEIASRVTQDSKAELERTLEERAQRPPKRGATGGVGTHARTPKGRRR